MTLDCTCNRLKEAEDKAAKWDALERRETGKGMHVTFECGGVEIGVRDNALLVNGEWTADFMDEDYASDFVKALDLYGGAMWCEGHESAKEGK